MLAHAPPTQRNPVLLLAAIHFALLDEPDHPLAAWYPTLTSDARDPQDPMLRPTLADFVHDRSPLVLQLLESRRVQTNEVGRCALLLAAFAVLAVETGPLAHLDVGTSAGLTTLLSHYSYRYGDEPIIGTGSPLLECATRGEGPVPTDLPPVAAARGLDLDPIDLGGADDARWLQACCWPDQTDRFDRLAAAIAVADRHPPRVVQGDAVEAVADLVHELRQAGHPVITTTWALNYLTSADRTSFMDELDRIGARSDLSWVIAESPAQTPELPHPHDVDGEHTTALTVVTWRTGERDVRTMATCHPHGYWLHWR